MFTLFDFLTEAQVQELEDYNRAGEAWGENHAEYSNEVAQFGDASFTCPQAPTVPEWLEEAQAKYRETLNSYAITNLQEITEDDIPF